MTDSTVISQTDARGVTRIALNRADKRNAFSDQIIIEMTAAIEAASSNPQCRVVIIAGEGKHFSAGADLNYMKQTAALSEQENVNDAHRLAKLMQVLDRLDKPTICRIQGAAYGGALGLITACDIAIGTDTSRYCLSEARLGITPAAIGPYVVRAIGPRQARRYFLSSEEIPSDKALEIGLIHERVSEEELDDRIEQLTLSLLRNGPVAMAAGKELVANITGGHISPEIIDYTARLIARLRTGDEGQEGLGAFFSKRTPGWVPES